MATAKSNKNAGAINLRPPAKGKERDRFLRVREQALAEFAVNKKAKNGGPTSFAKLFVEMGEARYAADLEQATEDAARKKEEAARQLDSLPSASSMF